MSKKIKLTKAIGGHQAGDTITVTAGVAEHLEQAGLVDKPAPKATTKKTDTDPTD